MISTSFNVLTQDKSEEYYNIAIVRYVTEEHSKRREVGPVGKSYVYRSISKLW